ncbi:MAG TPA: tetratricopeptide repeat protein, partial [Thermogutta sp.]|nr:tetratricopeptide repeat protein [Thermogutta sp.]
AFLLDQGQVAEAEIWQNRLEKVAPDAFPTLALRTRILTIQGRYDEAIQRLREFAEKETNTPPSDSPSDSSNSSNDISSSGSRSTNGEVSEEHSTKVQQLRWALAGERLEFLGRMLERSGKQSEANLFYEEAEKLYRKFVEKNPNARLLLASFLARRGKLNEGLELLEASWESSDVALVRAASQVFMTLPSSDQAIVQRVQTILEKACELHQRPLSLLMLLGDLYGMQGRFAECEAVYREILRRDPKNVIALNNLGAMLAIQGTRLDEAEKLVQTAIDLAGPQVNLIDSQAMVLIARKKPAEALKVLSDAIEDEPIPILFFRQAQAYQLLNKPELAAQAFEEAVKRGLTKESLHPIERKIFDGLENWISQGAPTKRS